MNSYIKEALKDRKEKKRMPIEICKQEKCTGCFTCMNICPKDAIIAGEDIYGKTIPVINKEKCIECGLCVKKCPINHPVKLSYPQKCYAAWGKEREEREDCASGGIATVFSNCVISENGVVYGTAFNDKLELVHTEGKKKEELQKFKGSKYVQSYIGLIFRQIKQRLEEGKCVLFIGTPCQVAGVKSYLGKDYENFLTVDIICHGTPPMKYLKEYMDVVDRNHKAKNIVFRGKKDYYFTLYDEEGVFSCKKSSCDFYFYGFLQGLIHRDNCYICNWARSERCSDITIGDFWGLDKKSLKVEYEGKVSVVLINTIAGKKFWEKYKNHFYWEERTVDEAINKNAQLKKPSVCHPDRKYFLERYKDKGFVKAVKTPKMIKKIYIHRIKNTALYKRLRKKSE